MTYVTTALRRVPTYAHHINTPQTPCSNIQQLPSTLRCARLTAATSARCGAQHRCPPDQCSPSPVSSSSTSSPSCTLNPKTQKPSWSCLISTRRRRCPRRPCPPPPKNLDPAGAWLSRSLFSTPRRRCPRRPCPPPPPPPRAAPRSGSPAPAPPARMHMSTYPSMQAHSLTAPQTGGQLHT